MLGFLDPPKEGVGDTLKSLYQYGVDVKILTGDNELVTQKYVKILELKLQELLMEVTWKLLMI